MYLRFIFLPIGAIGPLACPSAMRRRLGQTPRHQGLCSSSVRTPALELYSGPTLPIISPPVIDDNWPQGFKLGGKQTQNCGLLFCYVWMKSQVHILFSIHTQHGMWDSWRSLSGETKTSCHVLQYMYKYYLDLFLYCSNVTCRLPFCFQWSSDEWHF